MVTVATSFITLRLAKRSSTVWFCLVVILMAIPSTSAMGQTAGFSVPNLLNTHSIGQYKFFCSQLPSINHWFSGFGRLLRLGAGQFGALVYQNAVKMARQSLLCYLQHCIPPLLSHSCNHLVLGDISDGTQQKKNFFPLLGQRRRPWNPGCCGPVRESTCRRFQCHLHAPAPLLPCDQHA